MAGGRFKLSRAISDLGGGPVIMGIENNEKKVNLAVKLVGPQLVIYRDFYAKEWKQDLRSLDWVGGGPPCVWCSKAGGQSADDSRSVMIRFGAAEVADHFNADFADWEQPHEAAVLRGGAAIDDLDQSHSRCKKPMRRTPVIEGNEKGVEVVDNALLGGGSARLRLDRTLRDVGRDRVDWGSTEARALRNRPRVHPRRPRAGGVARPPHLRERLVHSAVVAAGHTRQADSGRGCYRKGGALLRFCVVSGAEDQVRD